MELQTNPEVQAHHPHALFNPSKQPIEHLQRRASVESNVQITQRPRAAARCSPNLSLYGSMVRVVRLVGGPNDL